MRKLIDGLAIASFVLSLTTVGAIGFGYLALTNKTNQEKIKNYAIGEAQKLLKDQTIKDESLKFCLAFINRFDRLYTGYTVPEIYDITKNAGWTLLKRKQIPKINP